MASVCLTCNPTSFNPRTRVGCDMTRAPHLLRLISFNPRTRVGCDQLEIQKSRGLIDVSIHAPVWGATLDSAENPLQEMFQSTHPCGVRPSICFLAIFQAVSIHAPVWGATKHVALQFGAKEFQSTHPCGVRLPSEDVWSILSVFQSTHPCGVRQSVVSFGAESFVSIHAPVWGATVNYSYFFAVNLFQSTHPCGVRLI